MVFIKGKRASIKTEFKKGHPVPKKWKEKFSNSINKKYKKGLKIGFQKGNKLSIGSKNPNWKGGISSENDKIRHNPEMVLWRKAVLERDNFTCQKYGIKGGKLVAHHINNFSEFPELRTAIANGIILSEKAHKEFHKKYGKKNNTLKQLKEFLKK